MSTKHVQTVQTDFIVTPCRLTDAAGEIHNLITEQQFPAGVYRVEFDTKSYWKNAGSTPFHDVADVSLKTCHHTSMSPYCEESLEMFTLN